MKLSEDEIKTIHQIFTFGIVAIKLFITAAKKDDLKLLTQKAQQLMDKIDKNIIDDSSDWYNDKRENQYKEYLKHHSTIKFRS